MTARIWIVLGLLALAAPSALAQVPHYVVAPGVSRQSVPQGLQVTPQAGTWLVCAASFSGEEAVVLACKMANILRERDKLPAYVIDYGYDERQKQIQEYEELLKRHPGVEIRPRFTRVKDHAAVLIGGFGDNVERATAALPRIKKLPAPDLRLANGQPAYDSMVNYEPSGSGTQVKKALVNPFHTAFVTRNALVPKPAQTDRTQDEIKFLRQLNANEEYSLLKCKAPYTLVIKEYAGVSSLQSQQVAPKTEKSFLQSLGLGNANGEVLNAGAMQAHELARFLRNYKFDTYVLHTRYSSLVTVGGFTGPEDEKLKRMQQQLAGMKFEGGNIDLMPTPQPFPIPR